MTSRSAAASAATYLGRPRRTWQLTRVASTTPVLGLTGVAGAVLVWAVLSAVVFSPGRLPAPGEVFPAAAQLAADGSLVRAFLASLGKISAGFLLGAVVGVPLGLAMGLHRGTRIFFQDLLLLAGNIPGLTYAILALVIFGIGPRGPVLAVALVSLPYTALNVKEGTESLDPHLLSMSSSFKVGRHDRFRHVYLPAVAPYTFVGLRYAFAFVWKVEAITEVFGGSSGIGFQIKAAYQQFSMVNVLAWTLWFGLFMVGMEFLLLRPVERRCFRWRA